MNIRFIDTSIVMNLLRIPHMCQEYESVKKEFNEAIEQNETLILPLATIIESGNHISHIADGNIRREKAVKFQEFLKFPTISQSLFSTRILPNKKQAAIF